MGLAVGFFIVALLYSSVGHGGASGYIAVMSLLSLAPEAVRPTALALNILVASVTALQFWRAGHLRWGLFWPFALPSARATRRSNLSTTALLLSQDVNSKSGSPILERGLPRNNTAHITCACELKQIS